MITKENCREIILESITVANTVPEDKLVKAKRIYEDRMLQLISKTEDIKNSRY